MNVFTLVITFLSVTGNWMMQMDPTPYTKFECQQQRQAILQHIKEENKNKIVVLCINNNTIKG